MEKTIRYIQFFMLIVSTTTLFSCAAAHKPLDLSSLSPLRVIRFDTPDMNKHSPGTILKSALYPTSWVCYTFLSDISKDMAEKMEGRSLRDKCGLPDFGQLVLNKFTGRVAKELHDWPEMLIENNPVQEPRTQPMVQETTLFQRYYEYKSNNILSFTVDSIHFWTWIQEDFRTTTVAELRAPTGELIWTKRYYYSQRKADREREVEEMMANNCKLLKEEMDYAAEKTVNVFIEDISKRIQKR